jgi:hypothetical protein
MTSKRKASVAGKVLTDPDNSGAAKSSDAGALLQRPKSKPSNVTLKSGKVISRTMATHRDALKRLADR